MRRWIAFLIIFFVGCAHRITVNPNVQPSALVSRKLPYKVAVVFDPNMKNYVEHATPSTFEGSAHTYDFVVGPSLSAALLRSVEIAYENVFVADALTSVGKCDRVIKFVLQNSSMNIYFQSGFLSPTAHCNYTLSVGVEAYDANNHLLLRKATVSGRGFITKAANAFSADKYFAKTVEEAIQQVSDNVANLLISGFAEPRDKDNGEEEK